MPINTPTYPGASYNCDHHQVQLRRMRTGTLASLCKQLQHVTDEKRAW